MKEYTDMGILEVCGHCLQYWCANGVIIEEGVRM